MLRSTSRPLLDPAIPAALVLLTLLALPALALAQASIPAVYPKILILYESGSRMNQLWQGGGGPYTQTRYQVAQQAVLDVTQSVPVGMLFGAAGTDDGVSSAPGGFQRISPFADIATFRTNAAAWSPLGIPNVNKLAESYSRLLANYIERPYIGDNDWNSGAFGYNCDKVIVIVIATDIGLDDWQPQAGFFTPTPALDYSCNDLTGNPGCMLDNVADYAWNGPNGGASVETHTILLDAQVSAPAAQGLLLSTSNLGGPPALYYQADTPAAVSTALWNIINDSYSGTYSSSALTISPAGDMLFTTFYEVLGGFPLYQGHMLGYQIDNNPASATYGDIVAGSGPNGLGELWDAGWLLASRTVNLNDNNQAPGSFNPSATRNGYIAFADDYASRTMYEYMETFDRTGINSGDLVPTLVNEMPNQSPGPAPVHDWDGDFDADLDDAQMLVNFIRGAPTVRFLGTATERGVWRMGDMEESRAVIAPNQLAALSTESHFSSFLSKIAIYPSMAYIASNNGVIHGFNLDSPGLEGSEMWFVVPRSKAVWDANSNTEYPETQLESLMINGQTTLNSGRLNLRNVWLDGYINDLPGCGGPGYLSGEDDGTIQADGCEWHRLLVWRGGSGAKHTYAIDVTNPLTPMWMWEVTDENTTSSRGQGRATGVPSVASFWDFGGASSELRYLTMWASGPQGAYASAGGAAQDWSQAGIYVHDVEQSNRQNSSYTYPSGGFLVPAPGLINADGSDSFREYNPGSSLGMFGSVAMADLDGDGSSDVAYWGDARGYLYKATFNSNSPGSMQTCRFASPDGSDTSRDIYHAPNVFFNRDGGLLVYYLSGSPYDLYDPVVGGVYAKLDADPYGCTVGQAAPCAAFAGSQFNSSGFMGFTGANEKAVGAGTVVFGRMFFGTHLASGNPCTTGNSRLYGINIETCSGGLYDDVTDSYSLDTNSMYTDVAGVISEPAFANNRLYALSLGGNGSAAQPPISVRVAPEFSSVVFAGQRHVF